MNEDLIRYEVRLMEQSAEPYCAGDGDMVFVCLGEDSVHAIEQAENAYPGCEIFACESPV